MNNDIPFHLGSCLIRPRKFSIEFDTGEKRILQPKFIEVLTYLSTHYPRLVDRQELIDVVWEGNHYVGEKALTNAIWNLRNELKQTNNQYIETVRKKGYRLLVEPVTYEEVSNSNPFASLKSKVLHGTPLKSLVVVAGIMSAIWGGLHYTVGSPDLPAKTIQTVTETPGREVYPAISPDKQLLIYSWRRIGHQPNLYIKDLANLDAPPRQLTYSDYYEGPAVWHPSGDIIFYPRKHWAYEQCDIVRMNIVTNEKTVIGQCKGELDFSLSISPNGKTLAFIDVNEKTRTQKVAFLSTEEPYETRPAYVCEEGCKYSDLDSIFSPDGKTLAISRTIDEGLNEDLFLLDITSGSLKQIKGTYGNFKGMAWHPSGNKIIYSANVASTRNGYSIDLATNKTKSLNIPGFSYPRFVPDSDDIIYHGWQVNAQLASISIGDTATAPFPVIQSDYSYHSPHFSKAANRITFISNQSGFEEVWMANPDGTNATMLTTLENNLAFPRWSNNGEYIAFLGPKTNDNTNALFVLNVRTRVVKTIESGFEQHFRPSWSNDDTALIAAAKNGDTRALYKFPLNNMGATLLLDQPVKYAEQHNDGSIYYTLGRNSGLWQFTPSETPKMPELVISPDNFRVSDNWEISAKGVFFQHDYPDNHQIKFFDFESATTHQLVKLPIGTIERKASMAVIEEDDTIVFTQLDFPSVDIKWLSNALN